MTLCLILIRHAKSSWRDLFSDDHGRVLNARGRASAQAVGNWMVQAGYLPDLVLCSDAARTRETADRHCQVVISGLRKAFLVELGDHLCGKAWPPIESVGSGVTV